MVYLQEIISIAKLWTKFLLGQVYLRYTKAQ